MAHIAGILRLETVPVELTIKSPPHEKLEHFLQTRGRSVACIGPGCVFCEKCHQKRAIWLCVELVFTPGEYRMVHIPHSDESMRAWLLKKGRGLIGLQVSLCTSGETKSGATSIAIHGQRECAEIPVAKYVAAIGVRDYWRYAGPIDLPGLELRQA